MQVQATATGYTDRWTAAQFTPPSKYTRHRPDEIDFGVGIVIAAIDLLMIFGWVYWAGRSRTRPRRASGAAAPVSGPEEKAPPTKLT
ncbi:hypothetical protein AB0383_39085 [Amycolatopsis sp. NPDC051373]|uniref:hypothetical protein n=1 Tax=Amycolatopsis sp. NPDC051373 TaxID=3155801 RepID=UPI00344F2533